EDFLTTLGISRALLADRLRRLSEAGIFEKVPYDSARPRYDYHLTEAGFALYPILQAIREWGDLHLAPEGAPLVYAHRGCTGSAVVTMTCSTCHVPLSARDIDVQLGPGLTAPESAPPPKPSGARARPSRARHRARGRRATRA